MKLTPEAVHKIAHLARLELKPKDIQTFATPLSSILTYIETLNQLDTTNIEPTAHATLVPTPFRDASVHQVIAKEPSLQNAPDRDGNYFRVPKVIA